MNSANFRSTDSVTLRYLDHGRPGGAPVLFLHGYTDSWFSFSRVLPLLPMDIRAIVPHQRGHGDSDRPEGPYTIDAFARDAVELMEALGLDSAIIAGHSMGSFVARRMAEIAPGRVRGLVLIGSARAARNEATLGLANEVLGVRDPVDRRFIREFQMSCVQRDVPEEFMDRVIEESAKVPARLWKDVLAALLEAPPPAASPCPTLIVGGDCDSVFSAAEQRALADHIPHADFRLYEQVGHSPQWEVPEQFTRDLVEFVRRIGTPVAAAV